VDGTTAARIAGTLMVNSPWKLHTNSGRTRLSGALGQAFAYDGFEVSAAEIATDGEVEISCLVRTTGDRPGPDHHRVVEPGEITVQLGASGTDVRLSGGIRLTGPVRRVGHTRVLHTPTSTD